jgi:hypothetical protein
MKKNGTGKGIKNLIPIFIYVILAISILSLLNVANASNISDTGIISSSKSNLTDQTYTPKVSIINTSSTSTSRSTTLSTALDTNLSFTTGGNSNWQVDSLNYHNKTSSAKSGKISNKSESWIKTTVTGPGTLKWWWKVSSESGYDYLKLYLDGTQIGGITGEVDWKQNVLNFKSGTHTILWNYKKDQYEFEGRDTAWLDGVQWVPGVNSKLNNNAYAILVGIADYKQIGDLSCPDDDVFDFYDICSRVWNMPTSHIYTSINSSATKINIHNMIKTVSSLMTSKDKLLFFFSGHGSIDMDTNPLDEVDGLDEYIDVYEVDNGSNKISDDELNNWFNNFPSKNILFIFDSCYSGGMAENRILKSSNSQNHDLNKYNVLMASAEDQLSYEYSELTNGVFTYYLCEAFQGANNPKIDLNLNGIVSGIEAFKYARTKTWDYAREQNPKMHDADLYQEFELLPDTQAPTVVKIDPINHAVEIGPHQTITITFNEFIQPGTFYNSIKLLDHSGNVIPIQLNLTGNYLTINPINGSLLDGIYTINLPMASLSDQDGNTLLNTFTSNFTVDATPPEVKASLKSGIYRTDQTVTFTLNESGKIYYTINGQTPNLNSQIYFSPFQINTNTILKFFALDLAGNHSSVNTRIYKIDKKVPSIGVNVPGNSYKSIKKIVLTMNEPGKIFYFLKDGTASHSSLYTLPFIIKKSSILYYWGKDLAGNKSKLYTQNYVMDFKSPQILKINPSRGKTNVAANQIISITFNEKIKSGLKFNGITLKTVSGVTVTTYKIIKGNTLLLSHPNLYKATKYLISLPTHSIQDIAGNYLSSYSSNFLVDSVKPIVLVSNTRKIVNNYRIVYLFMNEPGTIYYTTNGTKPTTSSFKYNGVFKVSKTDLIRYFAMDLASNRSPYYILTYYFNSKSTNQ